MIKIPNAWITFDTGGTTQLIYAVLTNPAPLTVSLPNEDPTLASLQVVITNPTAMALQVSSVSLVVPVGTGATLMPTTQNVQTAVSDTVNWSFTGPSSVVSSGTATFTLAPVTGQSVSLAPGASVTVDIYQFQTVQVPATAPITVKEMIQGVPPAFTTFNVTTFPYGFYFDSVAATITQGGALVPVAQVTNGQSITLVWNASVVDTNAVQIYYTGAPNGTPATPSKVGLWEAPALTCDSVYTVVVTAATVGGQPLTASLSVPVSVQNPALVASSLTASAATVNGTLQASTLTVSGATTLNGAVTATAATTLSNTSVGGTLGVSGAATLSSASLSGALSVAGGATITGLNATGGVFAALTSASALNPGTYQAHGDGFVVGIVTAPSDVSTNCVGWISGCCGAVSCFATGGNVCSTGDACHFYTFSNNNSFLLPVANGSSFSLASQQGSGNTATAPTAFYWIPLGTAAAPSLTSIESAHRMPFVAESVQTVQRSKDAAVKELLDLIGQLSPTPIDVDMRARLLSVLLRLNANEYDVVRSRG
jgi:fibronectin-binding autotransporter adhesin